MITFPNMVKTILVSVFVISIFVGCDEANPLSIENGKQIVEGDESILSDSEQNRYRVIAEKLAIRYVNEKDPRETEIPDEAVDFFYNGLIHLYNSNLEEAEIVTREYKIVAASPAHTREVLLWTDFSHTWLDNWRNGNTKTGISEIDQLIEQFDLTLNLYREYSVTDYKAMAEMRAGRPINVYAVSKLFKKTEEIKDAGPDRVLTGGRDVKAAVKEKYLLLDVTVGSGDCLSGCINKINHRFRIYPDGQVELAD